MHLKVFKKIVIKESFKFELFVPIFQLVINLVTSIEIPLPENPDSLDENDELLDGPTIMPK